MKRYLALLVVTGLAVSLESCGPIDRRYATVFEPGPDDTFYYRVAELKIYSEADRTAWLEQYLDDNDLCAAGYDITQRQRIKTGTSLWLDTFEIVYRGRCR